MERLSVIILNYNTPEMTRQCLEALVRFRGAWELEIILIDNGSRKKMLTDDWFRAHVERSIENPTNRGFAAAVNQGIEAATGEWLILLNSDAFLREGTLGAMFEALSRHPECGIAGPKTFSADGTFQVSAGAFPTLWGEFLSATRLYKLLPHTLYLSEEKLRGESRAFVPVDWISGGCMFIRREVIRKIGLMDEGYFFGVEDMDFCFRAKEAGFQVGYVPAAALTHLHSRSAGGTRTRFKLENERKGKVRFFAKRFPKKIWLSRIVSGMYRARMATLGFFGKLT